MTQIKISIDCDGEYCLPQCYIYFDDWMLADCCQIFGDQLDKGKEGYKRCPKCLAATVEE